MGVPRLSARVDKQAVMRRARTARRGAIVASPHQPQFRPCLRDRSDGAPRPGRVRAHRSVPCASYAAAHALLPRRTGRRAGERGSAPSSTFRCRRPHTRAAAGGSASRAGAPAARAAAGSPPAATTRPCAARGPPEPTDRRRAPKQDPARADEGARMTRASVVSAWASASTRALGAIPIEAPLSDPAGRSAEMMLLGVLIA